MLIIIILITIKVQCFKFSTKCSQFFLANVRCVLVDFLYYK